MAVVAGKTSFGANSKKSLEELLQKKKSIPKKTIDKPKTEKIRQETNVENNNEEITQKIENNQKDISFDELKNLFGYGFTESEYREMYRKFISLQNNYPLRTEMHKEALITYVKYAFKRDKAIADDDMDAADKWGKLCAKQATDARINPSQLSAADLSDGISNFSKIAEAVEREQDIIPILPKFKQQPQDVVDYTIWQYINYIRRLQNMPEVKYADIYKFMDEMYEANKKTLPFIEKEKNGHYDSNSEV